MFVLQWNSDQTGVWYEIDERDGCLSSQSINALTDCPKISPEARLIVLMPGQLIRMSKLTLPKMRRAERAKAIPFLVEEQLACEPDDIAVAFGDIDAANQTTVAIFDKARFQTKLALLNDHHLTPSVLIPDYLALLWESSSWTVTVCASTNIALVRTGLQSGFAIDASNLSVILKMQFAQAVKRDAAPLKIIFYTQDTVVSMTALDDLPVEVVTKAIPNQGVFDFSALQQAPVFNLLQGKYRPKHVVSAGRRNWLIATSVFILWLVILFGGHLTQWFYYAHKNKQASQQVMRTYQTIFPGAKTLLEPRFRVSTLLKKLKNVQRDDLFLRILSVTGKALNQYPDVIVKKIQFQKMALTLQVAAKNVTALAKIREAIHQADLVVGQQIDQSEEAEITATLTIQEKS